MNSDNRIAGGANEAWPCEPVKDGLFELGGRLGLPLILVAFGLVPMACGAPIAAGFGWFVAACAFFVASCVEYRQCRRQISIATGHCVCGYNLRLNTSGRCPECGRHCDTW